MQALRCRTGAPGRLTRRGCVCAAHRASIAIDSVDGCLPWYHLGMAKRSMSPKFATREIFTIMAIVAIGCAAITSPSDAWVATLRLIISASLLFAVLGAIYRQGPQRAFWLGYVLFGFTCAMTAWLFPQQLATDRVVAAMSEEYGDNLLHSPSQIQSRLAQEIGSLESRVTQFRASVSGPAEKLAAFVALEKQLKAKERQYRTAQEASLIVDVINALYPLIAGLIGGSAGSWFCRTSVRP